jgi:DNA invertase Pin-like site-specific DNA recombinase
MTTAATSQDTIRAALYARVSTTDQQLARQHAENLAAARRYGWAVSEYEDPGLSASRFARGRNGGTGRQEWGRLLDDLAAGQIGVLVLWEPSRGDRQLTGWAQLLDTCRRTGTLIYVTSQDRTYDLRNARDWRTLAEDGIDSAYESEKLSMRITSGKAEGRRAGRPQGSVAYGIHRVRDPERTRHAWLADEPDPETGPVVARIIREVGAGRGYAQIARGLDADGVPTPGGAARWHGTTITQIAGNPVYGSAGVVTEAESLAARARLARTARAGRGKGERPTAQRHRYSGCLACSVCGAPVRGYAAPGGARYRCVRGHVSIPAAEVDRWVDDQAVERLTQPDLLPLATETESEAALGYRAEAARLRGVLDGYRADAINETITRESFAQIERGYSARIAEAEAAAQRAEQPSALAGLPDEDREVVAGRWEALTVQARKDALRVLAPDAQLRPGKRGHASGGTGRHGGGVPAEERVVLWPEGR